jgi:putative phage-type endonuclease
MSSPAQGSEGWFQQRLGLVTASRLSDVMAKTKTGYGASRANYMAELICERLTGTRQNGFTSAAMEWGTATEPQARAAYEFYHDVTVDEAGFVQHPEIAESGASPDGFVGEDGLLEIKCCNTSTHIDILLSGSVPAKYLPQMYWQMACTGRQWCDFVSYDPRLPENLRYFRRRVERDDSAIADMEAEVRKFLAELDDKLEKLNAL